MKNLLVLLALFSAFTVQAQENGFIAYTRGSTEYQGVKSTDATASYFLVHPFQDSAFSFGAVIFNSSLVDSTEKIKTLSDGSTERGTYVDSIQHLAYGTLLGYHWAGEGLFGLQAWAATGYMSNSMTLDVNKISVAQVSSGDTLFCQADNSGKSKSVYTIPMMFGVGATVNGFGFFFHQFWQNSGPIDGDLNMTHSCRAINVPGATPTYSTDTRSCSLVSRFTMSTVGIQYLF